MSEDRFVKRLDRIMLNPTTACNFRCQMCDLWMGQRLDLDLGAAEKLLVDGKKLDVKSLQLSGGEPLFYRDIHKLLKSAKGLGYSVTISTNGGLIDEQMAELLSECAETIVVSLEGNRESQEAMRGEGAFDLAVCAIKNLKKYNKLNIGISMVVSKYSHPFMKGLIEVAKELELPWVNYQPFSKRIMSRRTDNLIRMSISPQDLSSLRRSIEETIRYAKKQNIHIANREAMLGTIPRFFKNDEHVHPRHGCSIPFHSIAVVADGNVCSCFPTSNQSLGNIYRQSIIDIWNSVECDNLRMTAQNSLCPGCLNGCAEVYAYSGFGRLRNYWLRYRQGGNQYLFAALKRRAKYLLEKVIITKEKLNDS